MKSKWRQRQRLELCYHKPRNTWGHQKLEKTRKDSSLEPSEEARPCCHLDFGCLAFRTVEEYISAALRHLVCGTFLQQPMENHTTTMLLLSFWEKNLKSVMSENSRRRRFSRLGEMETAPSDVCFWIILKASSRCTSPSPTPIHTVAAMSHWLW